MSNLNLNRVNEYLKTLDFKNLIILYLSFLIVFIIIWVIIYNNYFLDKINGIYIQEKIILKKIASLSKEKDKLKKLKMSYLKSKTELSSLRNDIKYLNSLVFSSKLYLSNSSYLKILEHYLKIAPIVNASLKCTQYTKGVRDYNIKINGYFRVENYVDFIRFIKQIEQVDSIVTIDNLILVNEGNIVRYDINVSLWSIK